MAPLREILIFEVSGQRHALPVSEVRELLPAVMITPVPEMAAGLAGVINLRGVLVPVLDLRARLGLPAKALAPADHFIVACAEERLLVIPVDQVLALVPLAEDALKGSDFSRATGNKTARLVQADYGIVILHQAQHLLQAISLGVTA